MSFVLEKAVRSGIIPIIGITGRPGMGKTFSALKLARGFVGDAGRIGVIDTENGRARVFADEVVGGYDHVDFDEPFGPERYLEAIEAVESSADITVIDSMSHEWDYVLELQEKFLQEKAGNDFKRREKLNMAGWAYAKKGHKIFMRKIIRTKKPIILCFRGDEKVTMSKNSKTGKTEIVTTEHAVPIFDHRFFFECTVALEVSEDDRGNAGIIHHSKNPQPGILQVLPNGAQIDYSHGQSLAAWCGDTGLKGDYGAEKKQTPDDALKSLKSELWALTQRVHNGDVSSLETWMHKYKIIPDESELSALKTNDLENAISKARIVLDEAIGGSDVD